MPLWYILMLLALFAFTLWLSFANSREINEEKRAKLNRENAPIN